jgi:hypothetical protein
MAPFFLDVWMEAATRSQETAVKAEKKTLFFIPANDDILASTSQKPEQTVSEA